MNKNLFVKCDKCKVPMTGIVNTGIPIRLRCEACGGRALETQTEEDLDERSYL